MENTLESQRPRMAIRPMPIPFRIS